MSFYYARKIIPLQYTFLLYGIGCRGYGLGKKRGGLGAKATEEQGLEGIRVPSQSARIWKKAEELGAKATEE